VLHVFARPETGSCGGRNRDSALLFLFHPVHRRRSFVNFADFVRDASVKQHALGRRGFAGIDVRHDADVSEFV
jgi:hypothetical protein